MADAPALAIALLALAATLATAIIRPPALPEALVALGGAVVLVALGAISLSGARHVAADLGPTIGFLAALLVLAEGCRREGVFTGDWRLDGAGLRRAPVASPRPHLSRRRARHRRARARRHRGPAHPGGLRHRGPPAHRPEAVRLRVHPSGQLGLAAARRLEPDQPARVPRHRALVRALATELRPDDAEVVALYVVAADVEEVVHGARAGLLGRRHPPPPPHEPTLESISEEAARELLGPHSIGPRARFVIDHARCAVLLVSPDP